MDVVQFRGLSFKKNELIRKYHLPKLCQSVDVETAKYKSDKSRGYWQSRSADVVSIVTLMKYCYLDLDVKKALEFFINRAVKLILLYDIKKDKWDCEKLFNLASDYKLKEKKFNVNTLDFHGLSKRDDLTYFIEVLKFRPALTFFEVAAGIHRLIPVGGYEVDQIKKELVFFYNDATKSRKQVTQNITEEKFLRSWKKRAIITLSIS